MFAALFLGMFIVLSVLAYIFMKQAFSSVKSVAALTRNMTAEDFSLRLDALESRDEIDELAETLYEMIARPEGVNYFYYS